MSTISNLHIDVTLTADDAARVLKMLKNQSGDTFDGVGGAADGAKAKIIALNSAIELGQKALGVFGMIVTGLGGVVKGMVEGNAQFEKYETSLKVMLGSAEAAKGRLKELSDFASSTPFELPEVVEAGNQIQAIGRYSKDTLRDLGDLASASGKPMEQATAAFTKLATGQKGVAVDMFRDLLISVDDWVAATGKGVKANGELEASTEEMLAALPKILEAKNFTGMMEEQSMTLDGMISNIKDSISGVLREIGGPLFGAIKNIMAQIVKVLGTPEMQQMIEKLGVGIAAMVEGLLPIGDALMPVLGSLMDVISELLPPLAELVAVLVDALKPVLKVIIDVVVQLAPVLGSLIRVAASIIKAWAPLIAIFAQFLGDLLKPLIPILQLFADLMLAAMPMYERYAAQLAKVYEAGFKILTKVLRPIIDGIRWIIENAVAAVNALNSVFGAGDDGKKKKTKASGESGGTGEVVEPEAPGGDGTGTGTGTAGGGARGRAKSLKDAVSEMIASNRLLIDDGQQTNAGFRVMLEARLAIIRGNSAEQLQVRKMLRDEIKAIDDKELAEKKKRDDEEKKLRDEQRKAEIDQMKRYQSAWKFRDDIRKMDMGEEELAIVQERDQFNERIRDLQTYYEEHLFTDQEYQSLRETLEFQHQEKLFHIERDFLAKRKDEQKSKDKAAEESRKQERDLALSQASEMFGKFSELAGENFAAQKAISIAQALINTYTGATKALEQGGIFGIPLMATVIAAGLKSVITLMGIKPAARRKGGLVPGGPQLVQMNEEGEEYVLNADATRRNRPLLDALNSGMTIAEATGLAPAYPDRPATQSSQYVELGGDFRFEDGALRAAIQHEIELDRQGRM